MTITQQQQQQSYHGRLFCVFSEWVLFVIQSSLDGQMDKQTDFDIKSYVYDNFWFAGGFKQHETKNKQNKTKGERAAAATGHT